MYYIAKVKFESINDNTGKIQKIKEEYLVEASSVSEVEEKLNDKFGEGMSEFSVFGVSESKILGVVE
jgi:hypothetical protein